MIAVGLAVIWAALNFVDLMETLYGLSLGHVERNPIAAAIYDAYGNAGLVALKLVLVVVALTLTRLAYERRPRPATALLAAGTLLMIYVVVHNAAVLEIV